MAIIKCFTLRQFLYISHKMEIDWTMFREGALVYIYFAYENITFECWTNEKELAEALGDESTIKL